MSKEHLYAVLSGDLVRSSKLTPTQSKHAMEGLREAADAFCGAYPKAIVGRLDTFRHDSWQLLLTRPEMALRAALFLRTAIKRRSDAKTKYDTRVAIGVGTVESIAKRRISDSRGDAFTRSGKGLDAMKGHRLAFVSTDKPPADESWIAHGIVPLLDCVVGDWTAPESRAVHAALMGCTQEETAAQWYRDDARGEQPTRQAVAKALIRAHWATLETVLESVESAQKQPPGVA